MPDAEPAAAGEPASAAVDLAGDLVTTHMFCHTQRVVLAQLREKFPALKPQVEAAELEWNGAFRQAEAGVVVRLNEMLGPEWQAEIAPDLEAAATATMAGLDEAQTVALLAAVKERAKGVMESPEREMLPASDPRFMAKPEEEFLHGHKRRWLSPAGMAAPGMKVTLEVPLSWKEDPPGDPPGLQLWMWSPDGGHGQDVFTVKLMRLPDLPPQEREELYTEKFARRYCSSLRYVSSALDELGGMRVGIIHATAQKEKAGVMVDMHHVCYYVVAGKALVLVMASTTDAGGPEVRRARLQKLEPLMKLVVGSVRLM